ncbi:MAG TPA: glycosyltransferase family 4 protein [Bacteroidia bacterium]|jgi:glycosyltransferase involved in cell wall biosynthesis|nr:glycosyltransferase family 4 protein [Bacteroidia bacterium]
MNLLVLNYEYPPLGGGAGVITQNISERLAAMGHKVTVVTAWYKTEKETEESGNLKIIRVKSKRKHTYKANITEMLSWIKESKRFLKEYCKKELFDICFANFTIPGGVVALFLKKQFGLKYTIISHGHDIPWRFPKQMLHFHIATYAMIKKICLESEINFVQTREMKENIDKFLGETHTAKNRLILNGIDARLFMPDYTRKSKQFKMVFTGRLVKQKDPYTVLKAIKLFSEKNNNFILHILGDGILRKGMEQYVHENGLEDYVKFFGWVSKEEMVKEYQSAHVNLIASVFEGMSIGIFESLACGCFLITTPIDDIEHIITQEENAVMVNFYSPEEMAGKLEEYYVGKYLKNYTVPEKLIDDLKTKFNWDKRVEEYETAFTKIMKHV